MAKTVRSWSQPDIPGLLGRKCVDWSIFEYGTHIPVEFHPDFEEANGGYHIERGESQDITLVLNDRQFKTKLFNIRREGVNIDTLQIRYDSSTEIKDYFIEAFKSTYNYLKEQREKRATAGESVLVKIPEEIAEYIEFYKTDEPFTYRLELYPLANEKLAAPFSKIFSDEHQAIWAFNFLMDTAKAVGVTGPDDPRISLRVRRNSTSFHFILFDWIIVAFRRLDGEEIQVSIPFIDGLVNLPEHYKEYTFARKENEPLVILYLLPLDTVRTLSDEQKQAFYQTLAFIKERSSKYNKSRFRKSHMPQLAQAIFNEDVRNYILKYGLQDTSDASVQVWWVNQGDSQKAEKTEEILWAPQKSADGKSLYHWDTMTELQKDDIVLHYSNGALRYVSRVISQAIESQQPEALKNAYYGRDGNLVKLEYHELIPEININTIMNALKNSNIEQGPFNANGGVKQGYLFRFTIAAMQLIKQAQPETSWPAFTDVEDVTYLQNSEIAQFTEPNAKFELNETYTLEQFCEDTGFDPTEASQWIRSIQRKGQAILYGPPGTGKTFVAEHLAKLLLSEGDGCNDLVQFHPAYSYEDFIQGIRPITKPDGSIAYSLLPGRFLEFCNNAKKRTGNCVLIIDEINRANLSRVFGELMYLLEYRDKTIPLAGGGSFELPKNVFIIGTMNTADRSIALVDHALRRRFAFLQLQPKFDILRKFHEGNGFNCEGLIQNLSQVNRQIGDKHYEIGISFFMRTTLATELEDIWTMEIEPYLEEYFADQPEKIRDFRWDAIKDKILS